MKKIIIYVWVITSIMLLAGCGGKTEGEAGGNAAGNTGGNATGNTGGKAEGNTMGKNIGNSGDIRIKDVMVQTSVRKTGQYPESICAIYSGKLDGISVEASDFKMTGMASIWGSDDKRPFEAGFSAVEVTDDTITLYPVDFPEKFFYADEYKVTCGKDERLNFTDKDVSKIITPVADDFRYIEGKDGSLLNYHIFSPADEENKPLVIVFHGFGDTRNLLTYRTAVDWAEPENQKKRPCYVIAPTIDDMVYYLPDKRDKIFEDLKSLIDTMILEGKVNSSKIYVMGNSFGGMSTIEFSEKYPDTVAAALALCPAVNYSDTAVKNLEKMKDVPIRLAHAEHDNTIPAGESLKIRDALEAAGAKEVKLKIYSDEEMNAAGADSAPDSTYSYHHVELAVMEDEEYKDWLFSF